MAIAVTTVASGGLPVTDVTATNTRLGMHVAEVAKGLAVTKGPGGLPVNFAPVADWPPARDADFASVKLLMGFNGADGSIGSPGMADESGAAKGVATVAGNAKISTAQSKFGGSSLLLDGSGDYLTFPDSADWFFGTNPFTIECWVYYNVITDAEFLSQWDTTIGIGSWKFGRTSTFGLVFNFYDDTNTLREVVMAWTPTTGVWYHVAVDRDASGVARSYVNGVMLGKATVPQIVKDSTKALSIGRIDHSTPRYFNGHIEEARITKGVARYASDGGFTLPTFAFPRS